MEEANERKIWGTDRYNGKEILKGQNNFNSELTRDTRRNSDITRLDETTRYNGIDSNTNIRQNRGNTKEVEMLLFL